MSCMDKVMAGSYSCVVICSIGATLYLTVVTCHLHFWKWWWLLPPLFTLYFTV